MALTVAGDMGRIGSAAKPFVGGCTVVLPTTFCCFPWSREVWTCLKLPGPGAVLGALSSGHLQGYSRTVHLHWQVQSAT